MVATGAARSTIRVGITAGLTAAAAGLLLAFGGPLVSLAVLLAGVAAYVILKDIEVGFLAVITIICLLPFATLPIDIGLTPTFLDLGLGVVAAIWAMEIISGRRRTMVTAPITVPLVIFLIVALFAFIFGLNNGPITPNLLRHFAELMLSISFVLIVIDYCRDWTRLERLVKMLLAAGAAAGLIAVGIWLLPDDGANTFLNLLQRIGYPGGWVIRYIEENPELSERAIGTSVDPNVLGGLLLMIAALAAPQIVSRRPLFSRRLTLIGTGIIVVSLILTFSRGAMVGFAAGLGYVIATRFRRLIPYVILLALLLLLLPVTQGYVGRFVQGFQGQDLATQMRFGEYKDALTLIGRYPIFGVGFAGTPDVDIYLGVANVYFTIAQLMGLVGLFFFFVVMASVFGSSFLVRKKFQRDSRQDAVWVGLNAALVGGLVAGIFDHYLFNIDFHHAVTTFWLLVGLAAAASRLGSLSGQSFPTANE